MLLIGALTLLILWFAGGTLSSSGYVWQILIGVFVIAHVWMMFKGHGGHGSTDKKEGSDAVSEKQPAAKNKHTQDGGCCH